LQYYQNISYAKRVYGGRAARAPAKGVRTPDELLFSRFSTKLKNTVTNSSGVISSSLLRVNRYHFQQTRRKTKVSLRQISAIFLMLLVACSAFGQSKSKPSDKFKQLEENLPTPNEYRNASGAPGHRYWQQRADYVIDVELDDANQRIIGKETITYKNLSPDTLNFRLGAARPEHLR
jgi:hypothetical protein